MADTWSTTQEEEELYRRELFRKAGKGDQKAKRELEEVYKVKLWSERERATLVYENPTGKVRSSSKKSAELSLPGQSEVIDDAEPLRADEIAKTVGEAWE